MRRLLAIALVLCFSVSAAAKDKFALPKELAPTQTEYGAYAAGFKQETWKQAAQAKGVSFEAYVRGDLKDAFASKAIPAIIDPSGQLRVLDGHHKLSALRAIERELGITTPVKLDIVKDYRGYSRQRYAEHLVNKLGKGYFGPSAAGTAAEKVATLPSSFDGLVDNPLRSVLGVVFTKSGLEGSWFADYIQFYLGEKLIEAGLSNDLRKLGLTSETGQLASDAAKNPQLIAIMQQRIFSDAKLVKYLSKSLDPGASDAAKKGLRDAAKRLARASNLRRSAAKPAAHRRRPRRGTRNKRRSPRRIRRR